MSRSEVLGLGGRAAASTGLAALLAPSASATPSGSSSSSLGAVLYDTRSSSFLPATPERYLKDALAAAGAHDGSPLPRVIFAGEEHTHRLHHAIQLDVIKAVDALDDAPTFIGLEMCWRQHQPALDAFVYGGEGQGGGDLELLARRTAWDRSWGYPIELYKPILDLARQRQMRLCGLNAPYAVVQAVSRVGLAGVAPQLRDYLPEVDLTNSEHRRRFVEAIGGKIDDETGAILPPEREGLHGPMSVADVQRSYEAMALWDEFMASSIAYYIYDEPPEGTNGHPTGFKQATGNERMVVLAGSTHVRGRVGLPDRYTRRTKLPTFTMVPMSVPWSSVTNRPLGLAKTEPASEADWVLYTRPDKGQAIRELSRKTERTLSKNAAFV